MKQQLLILSVFFCLPGISALAQEKSKAKFGNVTAADFATKIYSVDSNAHAVVLADIGSSDIEGNSKGWFSLVHKHYKRVHILNKNGYDIANVSIPLYTSGTDEEKIEKLKAVTYNLEDGKVVETKLEVKSGVFKDKLDKNRTIRKFTFPNVKEGSIIEYEYTIVSDFLNNLQPWEFQGAYPRVWSEYNLRLPSFLGYAFLSQGYLPFDINEKKSGNSTYNVIATEGTAASEKYKIDANYTDHRWVIKNAPAMKEESFTSTINNYVSKLEFQLSEYRHPLTYKNMMGTWAQLSENLMKFELFGEALGKGNNWLKDVIKPLVAGAANDTEKAKRIYAWLRDNVTCTDYSDVIMNQSIKNVMKSKNGSVADINLLLVAMLRYENIQADPVLLSTRSNGFIYPLYPLLSRFNYVVCKAEVDGKKIFLDATEPRLGFGLLPLRCYNGQARIMDKEATPVALESDLVKESSMTSVFLITDEKGKIVGSMQQTPGIYKSWSIRNQLKEKGQDEMIKDIKKDFGVSVDISNVKIDSLDRYEDRLGLSFDFDFTEANEDIIYLNPMFGEGYKDNPFKSAERKYPVEMPYTLDEVYTMQMEVPAGYEVDELPKQMVVKLNEEGDGVFEYRISSSSSTISLRSRLTMKRSVFVPEEYEMLREFFNLVVKKHNEQIVFKKKK